MKKSVCLLVESLLCLSLTSGAWAQMSVGVRTGVNLSNLSYDEQSIDPGFSRDSPTFKTRSGFNFAVLFNYALTPAINIQVEPGFSQRGARIEESVEVMDRGLQYGVKSKGKFIANYIEMPILFQYKPQLGKIEGIVSFGPELRLLTKPMKLKVTSKSYENGKLVGTSTDEHSLSGDDGIRKFDFGLAGGVGVAYPIGSLKIFGEACYHFGLNNLMGHFNGSDSKLYNRGASISVGVLVPIETNN